MEEELPSRTVDGWWISGWLEKEGRVMNKISETIFNLDNLETTTFSFCLLGFFYLPHSPNYRTLPSIDE